MIHAKWNRIDENPAHFRMLDRIVNGATSPVTVAKST